MCAKHGANLRGESPPRALMVGIASQEQGRSREAGSEGSWRQKSDSTKRNRIQGRGGGVSQHWMARPDNHSDTHLGKSGEARRKESRLTLGDLFGCSEEPN